MKFFWTKTPQPKLSPLLYDGLLSTDERKAILRAIDEYPFAIEVSIYPSTSLINELYYDLSWTTTREDCMGTMQTFEREGTPYAMCQKNFWDPSTRDEGGYFTGGGFIFFPSKLTYDRFLKAFSEYVINEKPFKVILAEETTHAYW